MVKVWCLHVAVLALAIGLAARISAAETEKTAGVVTAVSGPVTVNRESASSQALKFRDALYWRDVVEAGKDGMARVLLGGTTTVTVRELSRLELREEALAEGARYTVELISGKVRTSVARVLMRPGEQVQVRTRNVVASVRGTDFIVETVERPAAAGAFGLLGVREVAQGVPERGAVASETVVTTLSGVVEVSNRLAGTGRVEQVGAYQGVRVSGMHEPLRLQFTPDTLRQTLWGLTPPRPQQVKSGDTAPFVSAKVEQLATVGPSTSPLSDQGTVPGGRRGSRGRAVPSIAPGPGNAAVSAGLKPTPFPEGPKTSGQDRNRRGRPRN